MKFIQKLSDPNELIEWKKKQQEAGVNCNYSCFQNPEKKIVHVSLLTEQGYLCCYCCKRLDKNSSHIEHFAAQSKTDDDLSVDYRNLHASCGSAQHWPPCCGNHRENNKIPISPLDEQCESYFTYTSEGNIAAIEAHPRQTDAERTIRVLNLNFYDLQKSREEAFDALTGLSDDDAEKLLKQCYEKDEDGRFRPFCAAVANYIMQYFNVT